MWFVCFREGVGCWLVCFREGVESGWCVSERVLRVVGVFQRGCSV